MRLALLALLLLASPAFADRREWYVLLEAGPALEPLQDAPTSTMPGTGVGLAVELQGFYGLTNALHLGVYGRGFFAPDIAFQGVSPTLADGSRPTGTLYENTHGFGAGALARWRFDTGIPLAPFVQLELGASWRRFRLMQLIPTGRDFAITLPDRDEVALDGRLAAGVEYRIGDHVLLELLAGARRALSPTAPWQFTASLAGGVVW